MHSYADTFEQPDTVEIDGKKVSLPTLSQRDLLPWIDEETKKRQEIARRHAPVPAAKDNARAKWMDWVDNMEITPGDLQPLVFRASGTLKVLGVSLNKAGVNEDAANKFIDSRPAKDNEMLAVRVSGLFRREEIALLYPSEPTPPKKDERSDPNSPRPESRPSDDQTGQLSAPSSNQ